MSDGFVYFEHKGNFNKLEKWLNKLKNQEYLNMLSKYGEMGVNALRAATPVDTGLAASSWSYSIEQTEKGTTSLIWSNSDIEGGCKVVILVDRGHATKSGGWVPGRHFIDAALDPVIEQIVEALSREV